jgi:hypothetical protein
MPACLPVPVVNLPLRSNSFGQARASHYQQTLQRSDRPLAMALTAAIRVVAHSPAVPRHVIDNSLTDGQAVFVESY